MNLKTTLTGACEISVGEADEEESEEELPGSVLVKMANDGLLNLYVAGSLLPKIVEESQAAKENPYL